MWKNCFAVLMVICAAIPGTVIATGAHATEWDEENSGCNTEVLWEQYEQNCDGWHITTSNDTSAELVYDARSKASMNRASYSVAPGVTTAEGRGRESWVGGPDDVWLLYHIEGFAGGMLLQITGDRAAPASLWCGITVSSTPFRCEIVSPVTVTDGTTRVSDNKFWLFGGLYSEPVRSQNC